MKNLNITNRMLICVLSAVLALSACIGTSENTDAFLVPQPLSSEQSDGSFRITANTVLSIPGEDERTVAEGFANLFTHAGGFTPAVQIGEKGDIRLLKDTTLKAEAYELQVTPKQIDIKASDSRGFFYGRCRPCNGRYFNFNKGLRIFIG